MLEKRLEIKTRKYNFKTYPDCFVGTSCTKMILKLQLAKNEKEAIQFGNKLMDSDLIVHVAQNQKFHNRYLFYRFTEKYYKAKQTDTAGLFLYYVHKIEQF